MSTGGAGNPFAFSGRHPGLFRVWARTYAFYLSSLGLDRGQIYDRIVGKSLGTAGGFGELTPQQAGRLATNVTRIAGERFANFFFTNATTPLPRGSIPRAEVATKFDTAYRFIVTIIWRDREGNEQRRPYVVDSDRNLSGDELAALVRGEALGAFVPSGDYQILPGGNVAGWHIVAMELTNAERRSG